MYDGALPFGRETLDLGNLPRPRTKVMMNVGNPDQAFSLALLPNDGVGLARIEFIISGMIQVHPLALTCYDILPDGSSKQKIAELTRHHPTKPDYFVDRLADGLPQLRDRSAQGISC